MPLSVDGHTLARATVIFYIIIMFCLLYMAVGFWRELRNGVNGVTFGLMFVFATLANEHFYLAVASWLVMDQKLYAIYEFGIWLWRFLTLSLIVASFTVLFIEFRSAKKRLGDGKPDDQPG